MHSLPCHSARHVVHYLPAWRSLIQKGRPLGSLLRRRVEALNSNGLSADGDSPLASSAQHGVCAKPVGVDKVQLSQNWCAAVTPSPVGCLQGVGRHRFRRALLLLVEPSLTDTLLSPRVNTCLRMSLALMGFGTGVDPRG